MTEIPKGSKIMLAKQRLSSAVNLYDEYIHFCYQILFGLEDLNLERIKKETRKWDKVNEYLRNAFENLEKAAAILNPDKGNNE